MTKKLNPLENPPAASSSDDDDELVSSAAEEEADSSSEESDQHKPPPSSSAVTIAIPGKTASDSESGSETETDSESESILNKHKSPPPPQAKRSIESTEKNNNSSKRLKKDGEDPKKRLWTEEDEIAVLQGMIDFKNDTGNSPYDYIKRSISFEVSKNQFMDKLRSLKKKYMSKDKPSSFTKLHDQKSYNLCKYIWGPDGMGLESAVKSNGKSKKVEMSFASSLPNGKVACAKKCDWFEKSFLVRGIAGLGVDEKCVKQRWSLVPVESKKRVEDKVKMLQDKELEFVLEKTEILREVTSMIAEASKNMPFE